jgi:hypothetical protein
MFPISPIQAHYFSKEMLIIKVHWGGQTKHRKVENWGTIKGVNYDNLKLCAKENSNGI